MKVALATLGCKVNHYETQAMQELFSAAGWEIAPFPETADVYVVNTCTVTKTGDLKSRQLVSRAHRANPDALIVVCGCYAQTAPKEALALPGVAAVIGTTGRAQIVERVQALLESRAAGAQAAPLCAVTQRIAQSFEPLCAVRDGRTRATLKIQDGCANYCSYCIIPYARGPVRSMPLKEVARALNALAAEGYREVVLAGIHLASYGRDLGGCSLTDVIALTASIDGLERVRLGSLEPKYVSESFIKLASETPKLCRQFHLSLQSGSDAVLARMNRRYTAAEYRAAAEALRAAMPDCALTTDVIAGFCGETEAEHRQTLAFCEEMAFARMHVFPYSVREGTRAASMPGQLDRSVKQARARELIALGKTLSTAFLRAQLGTVQQVLVESDGCGYTGNYVRVRTGGEEGALKRVRITRIDKEIAIGEELTQ